MFRASVKANTVQGHLSGSKTLIERDFYPGSVENVRKSLVETRTCLEDHIQNSFQNGVFSNYVRFSLEDIPDEWRLQPEELINLSILPNDGKIRISLTLYDRRYTDRFILNSSPFSVDCCEDSKSPAIAKVLYYLEGVFQLIELLLIRPSLALGFLSEKKARESGAYYATPSPHDDNIDDLDEGDEDDGHAVALDDPSAYGPYGKIE